MGMQDKMKEKIGQAVDQAQDKAKAAMDKTKTMGDQQGKGEDQAKQTGQQGEDQAKQFG